MKSIKLMFLMLAIGMIAFMSCSTETEQTQVENEKLYKNDNFEEIILSLQPVYENTWYSVFVENETYFIRVHGQKEKEIIDVVNGNCETCKVKCTYGEYWGDGIHLVHCDNGNSYFAIYCGGSVMVVNQRNYLRNGGSSMMLPTPC